MDMMLCKERWNVNRRLGRRALQPCHPNLLHHLCDAPARRRMVVAVEAARVHRIHQVHRGLVVWQEPWQRQLVPSTVY